MKNIWNKISNDWKGALYANLVGCILCVFATLLSEQVSEMRGLMVFSEFFIVPFIMGILCVKFLNEDELSGKKLFVVAIQVFAITLAWAVFILGEGYICLLIVSPVIIACLYAGALLGRLLYNRHLDRFKSSIIGVLLVVYLLDIIFTHSIPYEVGDTLLVNAPPSKVWNNVVAFDEVEDPSEYWLFDIGLPKVVKATVIERKVGGDRKCVFENGIAFDEKIVVYDSLKDLTFDIVKMPEDPEIIGHINLKRGQFKLKDNGNGTTTLIGTSWYDLKVFPAWYYNIWAESITREVHLRAMKHIKKLSER